MAICEWCGDEFDKDYAEEYFEAETFMLSYSNLTKCLCGECAVNLIENDKADSVYMETCTRCGKSFDLCLDESEFDSYFDYNNGIGLKDCWEGDILCANCAINKVEKESDY